MFTQNDQETYAGVFIAQHFAESCARGSGGGGGRRHCATLLHDGGRRCVRASGAPVCGRSGAAAAKRRGVSGVLGADGGGARRGRVLPTARLALDYEMRLFENLFRAGRHRIEGGRLKHASGAIPVAIHLNGPAKVVFEPSWQLPGWDASSARTPAQRLAEALCARFDGAQRAAAAAAFVERTVFFDSSFRRVEVVPPLNFTCHIPR